MAIETARDSSTMDSTDATRRDTMRRTVITGIVRSVAKNGGLRLVGDEAWYDPMPGVVASQELKGRSVQLELVAEHRFCAVREALSDRDVLISRQVAVKAAAEFMKADAGKTADTNAALDLEQLLASAATIEAWILR
jgi:hypothetical protein